MLLITGGELRLDRLILVNLGRRYPTFLGTHVQVELFARRIKMSVLIGFQLRTARRARKSQFGYRPQSIIYCYTSNNLSLLLCDYFP